MVTATMQTLAGEAYGWMETATRGDSGRDEDRYTRIRDGAPQWVTDLVYAAHGGDFLPDDWRYQSIASALEFMSDVDDLEDSASEWSDANVDVYTGARLLWLASNLQRPSYCDEGVAELGGGSELDIVERVGLGQYMESSEVYALVLRALEERLEDQELES